MSDRYRAVRAAVESATRSARCEQRTARRRPSHRTMRQFRLARGPYFLPATVLVLRQHLRKAGLPGSMGTIGDDNAVMASFWGTLRLELLDTRAREPAKNLVS